MADPAPHPNVLSGLNGWFPSGLPWAEYIGPHGSTQESAFGYGNGNQAVMTIAVSWANEVEAVQEILGVGIYNTDTGNLDRQIPLKHPRYGSLYATRISGIHPLRFEGKLPASPFRPAISVYMWSLITIVFTMPKYSVISDTDLDTTFGAPRQEWQRWTSRLPQPTADVLQRPAGTSYRYDEGPAGINGVAVNVPINQPQIEEEIVVKWWSVPKAGLFGSLGGVPGIGQETNLLAGLNTINNAPFMGYQAETLRFDTYRMIEQENPIAAATQGVNPLLGLPLIYDVELVFRWRDPPVRFDPNKHGWNLFPGPGGDLTWYHISSIGLGGAGAGQNFLLSSDFANLFRLNS